MRNYLQLKVLFCKQTEYYVFAIINIFDTLNSKTTLYSVTLPSYAIEILESTTLKNSHQLEVLVKELVYAKITSNNSFETNYIVLNKIADSKKTSIVTIEQLKDKNKLIVSFNNINKLISIEEASELLTTNYLSCGNTLYYAINALNIELNIVDNYELSFNNLTSLALLLNVYGNSTYLLKVEVVNASNKILLKDLESSKIGLLETSTLYNLSYNFN